MHHCVLLIIPPTSSTTCFPVQHSVSLVIQRLRDPSQAISNCLVPHRNPPLHTQKQNCALIFLAIGLWIRVIFTITWPFILRLHGVWSPFLRFANPTLRIDCFSLTYLSYLAKYGFLCDIVIAYLLIVKPTHIISRSLFKHIKIRCTRS